MCTFLSASCLPVELPADGSHQQQAPGRILVCQGKACCKAGSQAVLQQVAAAADSQAFEVLPCECLGECKQVRSAANHRLSEHGYVLGTPKAARARW